LGLGLVKGIARRANIARAVLDARCCLY
jgi:hypothetical protein